MSESPWPGERRRPLKIEAVLFDLDGTLVDTIPLIIKTYRKVFEAMKIPWATTTL
ncbi:MAG: HAD hydrolase-like protein [Eubacteriales bacterium]